MTRFTTTINGRQFDVSATFSLGWERRIHMREVTAIDLSTECDVDMDNDPDAEVIWEEAREHCERSEDREQALMEDAMDRIRTENLSR